MRNVLFLAEELRYGGAESYFLSIENNIDRSSVNFYSMAVDGKLHERLRYPQNFFAYSFSLFDRYRKAKKLCLEKKIEVVHVNSLRLAFVAAKLRKIGVKTIYTKHNITILEKISKKIYAIFLNRRIDIVNVISYSEKEYLMKIGVKAEKIVVIHNGIDIKKFTFESEKNNDDRLIKCCMLARISPEKNHGLFIDIAEIITKANNRVRFYIAGDGPDREKIGSLIKEKGLEDYFEMPGFVESSVFLKEMDYMFLLSHREVLPMSIIEGMASGVIVISKKVGAVDELIDENCGYIIEGDNATDYYNAFLNSIQKKEKEKRLCARRKAENLFSLELMMEKITSLYKG